MFCSFLGFLFFSCFYGVARVVFGDKVTVRGGCGRFFGFFLFSKLTYFSCLSLMLCASLAPRRRGVLVSSLKFVSIIFVFGLMNFDLVIVGQ